MKKIIACFCLISIITPHQFSLAQQVVDLTGKKPSCAGELSARCGWGDFGSDTIGGGDLGLGNIGDGSDPGAGGGGGYDYLAQERRRFNTDIRCALALSERLTDKDYSKTLSTDDDTKRLLAASAAQNLIFMQSTIGAALMAEIWDMLRRRERPIITITFADGGTEQYYVGSVYSSLKVIGAVPGSHRPGTGKEVPSTNCPRFA